ncbi:hypothetical protein F4779DRAFT_340372 [Xylariaceae sp. FL0662B]|nr:hypothetical protein F4779DRAFT_340372 [Xylariaceae sp. FL0662B]
MTAKTKASNPLNGLHTAGIFSNMSIDGPDIGTLVLIVDRAKNLPNRKTIGKQDPYCAARLGKEAKKTTTDIRGGQTPKWDQELRFTVHDSPDYYQLKLSVFNDDKKTDLIGETWIDLRDIIVQGGGQSDQWHSLTCRGKYAGETRIEITYYDSRPKPEKPAAKPRPMPSSSDLSIAAGKTPVKRRPLPSDPVTGQAPSPPVAEHVHTPPSRAQPNPPTSFIPNQSPLQAVEYSTPPSNRHTNPPDQYSPLPPSGSQYSTPPQRADPPQHRTLDRNYKFPPYENEHFRNPDPAYSRMYEPDPRTPYNHGQPEYESPSPSTRYHRQPVEDDERPPPPPVHRVRNSSGNLHELATRGAYDVPQHKATPPMRHDVLRSEAHRHSISSPSSSYPGRPTYRPYDSAPDMQNTVQYHEIDSNHASPPRHHSYDSAYDSHPRSMQPTVEDVPESWTPPNARPQVVGSRTSQYNERDYNLVPSPAPLNLGGRGSASPAHYSPVPPLQPQQHYDTNGYSTSPPPMSSEDYSQALTLASRPYANQHSRYPSHPNEVEDSQIRGPSDYDMPPVPPTLVPGVDPALAREISDQIHQERRQERRYTQPPLMSTPPRGRQQSEPPSDYGAHYSPHGHHPSSSRNYDMALVTYSGGHNTPSGPAPVSKPRGLSPSPTPNHTIRRKSVSPAPPPTEARRLSGVPFGPDDYEALNPTVASAADASKPSEYTNADGKIITADGREVDPSDHLPMDTWAPEPEPKKSPQPPETRSRPVPSGAQPMPPSSRRPLRIAARPQSMAVTPPAHAAPEVTPSPPSSTGRNRLQKKAHRASALPAPISSGSSPLGPSTPHQRNSTPPRALVRASTFDYENYGPPYGGGSPGPGVARPGYGSGPPIPAKVPMMSGGLGPAPVPSPSGGGDDWALMEEMSKIDIGAGRARRHHGGY